MTTKIYLAGPIKDCTKKESSDWRNDIKIFFASNKHIIFNDPVEFEVDLSNPNDVVNTDLEYLNDSDLVVVNMWKPGIGTSMEIVYAWQKKIPIYIAVPLGEDVSPWLKAHSNYITDIKTLPYLIDEFILNKRRNKK